MNEETYGIIYKITNLINNKIYIGQKLHPYKTFKYYYGSGKLIKELLRSMESKILKKKFYVNVMINKN